jgi:hypothetical protein
MNEPWVRVYSGSFASVLANQATLEASGIPTVIPNETMKVLDPFITGGNVMDAEIRVPNTDAEMAVELLRPADSAGTEDEFWYSKPKSSRDRAGNWLLKGFLIFNFASLLLLIWFQSQD